MSITGDESLVLTDMLTHITLVTGK